jgi:hypothetical protein
MGFFGLDESLRNAPKGFSSMAKHPEKPRFSVVSSEGTGLEPPPVLGPAGAEFWRRVQSEFGITDVGGVCLLEQICGAIDRIQSITEAIAVEGPAIRLRKGGVRANPLLRDELQNRAFVSSSLERLGITAEPVKAPGHPVKPFGWTGER